MSPRRDDLVGAHWIGRGKDTLLAWNSKFSPSPLLRLEFKIAGRVARARLHVCGLGYHEARINGQKVGSGVLDPVVTHYDRRVRYLTHDVGALLRPGENALGVILGNGWYNCATEDVWHFDKASWRDLPKLAAKLDIALEDGMGLTFISDSAWRTSEGPLVRDQLRNGEEYDARREQTGWDGPGFNAAGWEPARIVPGPGGVLEPQLGPSCRVAETLAAVTTTHLGAAGTIFDFGRNIAGWARLRVQAKAGTVITLRYAEKRLPAGGIDQGNISGFIKSGECQCDRYTCKGGGEEIWEPRFTYHGFQYVQLSGLEGPAPRETLEARVVRSDFEGVGSFRCSDMALNRLYELTRESYLSNFVGIPTDCPHREKNGWTGDAQLAAEFGLLNFDAYDAYSPWLDSMADAQRPSGQFPGIVPSTGWGYNWGSGPAWDAAFLVIPWLGYLYAGRRDMIERHFDNMRRYMDFCASMAREQLLEFGLGDWCHPDSARMAPARLTSTGYYHRFATLMARFAALLGRREDATAYQRLAAAIKAAFNRSFYKGEGNYAGGELTSLGCALYFGLCEEDQVSAVAQRLAESVASGAYKADFGILGAQFVPRALALHGHADTAYRLLTQRECPGWLHWLDMGATSLWEDWKGENSRNHIMFGDISAWMVNFLAGIQPDPEAPGFARVRFVPNFVAGLDAAQAEHRSAQGWIRSAWRREAGGVELRLEIPQGCTGALELPAGWQAQGTPARLAPGRHELLLRHGSKFAM